MRIGYTLPLSVIITVGSLAGLSLLAWAVLNYPRLRHAKTLSLHDAVGVLQLVFATIAGAGALVALIVAYRRQRLSEATAALDRERWLTTSAHDRTRLLNERFTAIAQQLGHEHAAVRLAGVHAMAGLADDWPENRQTCIDVLCAYLRMPYESDPGNQAPVADRLAFGADREVRHTVIRVIAAHLSDGAAVSWQGCDLDFTGVRFDGGNFSGAHFSGGLVSFQDTEFSGGEVSFAGAQFSGGEVSFAGAQFSGGEVSFGYAQFSGGNVSFAGAQFSGGIVHFGAQFSGGEVQFGGAQFSGGKVHFSARFSGGKVHFVFARFSGGKVSFGNAEFTGGEVSFLGARFTGAEVSFEGATFSGGEVDFSKVSDLSSPPSFGWTGTPPAGIKLPSSP